MIKYILQIAILISLTLSSYSQGGTTIEKSNNTSDKKPLFNLSQKDINKIHSTIPKRTDITGVDKGSGGTASFDEKYYEMAIAYNLNAFAQPSQDKLDEMLFEYNMKKYLKWGGMILGLVLILFLIVKIAKSNSKKSSITN